MLTLTSNGACRLGLSTPFSSRQHRRAANYRGTSSSVVVAVSASSGMASEAVLADRLQDRSAWIANYRSKSVGTAGSTGSASAASSEASLEERLGDRSAWIANHRQKSSQKVQRNLSQKAAQEGMTWLQRFNENRAA